MHLSAVGCVDSPMAARARPAAPARAAMVFMSCIVSVACASALELW